MNRPSPATRKKAQRAPMDRKAERVREQSAARMRRYRDRLREQVEVQEIE